MQSNQMTEWEKLATKIESEEWRDLASSIAITVLTLLHQQKMTKQQLADKMGVKPQYVSRVVKGHANITLDTIVKLEKALGKSIISVSDPTAVVVSTAVMIAPDTKWQSFLKISAIPDLFYAVNTKRQPKQEFSDNIVDNYALAS